VGTVAHQSRDPAIDHWNTRHGDSGLSALVQEAVAEIERLQTALRAVSGRCTPEMEQVVSKALNPQAPAWKNNNAEHAIKSCPSGRRG
jgi:hypothetical protein